MIEAIGAHESSARSLLDTLSQTRVEMFLLTSLMKCRPQVGSSEAPITTGDFATQYLCCSVIEMTAEGGAADG